jgi:ferredoxin like protein
MKTGAKDGGTPVVDVASYLGPPALLSRDDKLATLAIKVHEGDPHLKIIDQKVCLNCREKPCTVTCPVENYKVEENGHTTIFWSSCIECGTCRIICPFHNISWVYPAGGFGVSYRYG